MSIDANAGNAILALSASSGVANWLTQADALISIVVGVLSAVGIVYSIIWHSLRIKQARANKASVATSTVPSIKSVRVEDPDKRTVRTR